MIVFLRSFRPSSLKATLPTKPSLLSSLRIIHPLLILQVDCTSLRFVDLLTNLRCRSCLFAPIYENHAIIPHMKAQSEKTYSFHQMVSSDVLNLQWHFFKKVPWGIVHYYSQSPEIINFDIIFALSEWPRHPGLF